MRYERGLRIGLRERLARVMKSTHSVYGTEIRYFRSWILERPALKSLVESVERSELDLDPGDWVDSHFDYHGYSWPPTEVGRVKVCWSLINRWADGEDPRSLAHAITHQDHLNDAVRDATVAIIEPVVEYLEANLGAASDVLYLLEKYKRRCEWFEGERLWKAVESDRARGEAICDRDLRQFLFEQGVDYPFSQPSGPSGKADVVSGLEQEDPLVCELKLFDGLDYGVPYVAKGAAQAYRYARDYSKPVAYLVVANLTDEILQIEGVDGRAWPPRVTIGDVTVYVVIVQLSPLEAASKQGKPKVRKIKLSDLVPPEIEVS